MAKDEKADQQRTENAGQRVLTFVASGKLYALPGSEVSEIIRMQPVTRVPGVPDFIAGVINLRGKIVPMIDLRLRLGHAAAEYTDRTAVIVAQSEDLEAGLIVDSVAEFLEVSEGALCEVSEVPTAEAAQGIRFSQILKLETGAVPLLRLQALA